MFVKGSLLLTFRCPLSITSFDHKIWLEITIVKENSPASEVSIIHADIARPSAGTRVTPCAGAIYPRDWYTDGKATLITIYLREASDTIYAIYASYVRRCTMLISSDWIYIVKTEDQIENLNPVLQCTVTIACMVLAPCSPFLYFIIVLSLWNPNVPSNAVYNVCPWLGHAISKTELDTSKTRKSNLFNMFLLYETARNAGESAVLLPDHLKRQRDTF